MRKDNYKNVTVLTLPVGQLKTNCYLLVDKQTNKTLIIDAGDDAEFLERIISENKLQPEKIIATHGHFDHILAVTELQMIYHIPFLVNAKDEFLVKNTRSSSQHFLGINFGPVPHIDAFLKDKISLGENDIQIIPTPGHTPGGVCLFLSEEKIIFVGDLIFAAGVAGRTDLSYSDKNELNKSVAQIRSLPGETYVYPGHGESFILAEFRNINLVNRLFVNN